MGNLFCCRCATKCETLMIDGQLREKCPNCGFIYYKNPSPAISVIVINEKKIALGKRIDNEKWCLPCGYIEYGETFIEASIREVKEEIGIYTEPQKIINVVSNSLFSRISSVVIVIISKPLSYDLCGGDDISEAKWFDIHNDLPELAFDADRYIIEKIKICMQSETEISGIFLSERKTSFIQI